VIIEEDDYLAHYGIIRKSGRYPWGSSNNVTTQKGSKEFLDYVADLKAAGFSEKEAAEGMGISINALRSYKTYARNKNVQSNITTAYRLREKGWSHQAIADRMGLAGESSVRALLDPSTKEKAQILTATSDMLREQVHTKGGIDVGKGVEHLLGISRTRLDAAIAILREEGYELWNVKVRQQGTGEDTTTRVLAYKGSTQKEFWQDKGKIRQINEKSHDGGRTFLGIYPPLSINPKRVAVNYKEDGGDKADGVLYVRPGVKDVSLGNSRYAQVRVQVGKGHFLKGMAMYKHDLPEGVDILFNTNKSRNDPKIKTDLDAMKPLVKDIHNPDQPDPDNPFGAVIKVGGQQTRTKRDGTTVVTSVMNILTEEGDWQDWSKTLSSQMLSKQSPRLAKTQLAMTLDNREREYKEIMELTNPTIKRRLLESFARDLDSSAVHLKAAALSQQQRYHVILPVNSLAENEIYAPNYENGTRVVLIRHPHGGTFEIPELVVNNKHKEAKELLDQSRDAVGINSAVAERLSGADFDGDTVIVIPNEDNKVSTTPALAGLKDFDPRMEYPGYEGMPPINTQKEMGDVSNLITDMTIKGASPSKLARAIRHSMVVIDAEKHDLNYRESAIRNGIKQLKQEYQGRSNGGSSTLVSRAGGPVWYDQRKDRLASEGGPIDPETGKRVYTRIEKQVVNKKGESVYKQTKGKRLAETDDAFTLIDGAGFPVERTYAEYSNKVKDLANKVRLDVLATKPLPYSKSAKLVYQAEVNSLANKLMLAEMNIPQERAAQRLAGVIINARRHDRPSMDDDELKKVRYQALNEARYRMGAKKDLVVIEPNEWDAIQAGAVTPTRLNDILNHADMDVVKRLATPRQQRIVTPLKLARAQQMMANGATRAEVASALGIALGTLDEALYGGG
jgi:biotin operon repressor